MSSRNAASAVDCEVEPLELEALDELSVELDEVESLALVASGGGPPTPPGPSVEPPLAELWLLSELEPELLSCERKLSIAADSPTAAEASDGETVLLADAPDDAEAVVLALDWSEVLLWLA